MIWWQILLVIIISYFMGNISFGRIISNTKKMDITKLGSGNPGATNILRNMGFKAGVFTLILDMVKGLVPCVVVYFIFGGQSNENISVTLQFIAGISVITGHIYPVLYKFRGGKGIATMVGVFFAIDPLIALIVIVLAGITWLIFKYGSVASFVCVISFTVIEALRIRGIFYLFCEPYYTISLKNQNIICVILFAIFIITWFAHRKNIERLLVGKESKVDLVKSAKKRIKEKL